MFQCNYIKERQCTIFKPVDRQGNVFEEKILIKKLILSLVVYIFRSCVKTLYHTLRLFRTLKKKPLENIVGKEENASKHHFFLVPQCFLPILKRISIFQITLILLSANAFNLDQSKSLLLTLSQTSNFRLFQIERVCRQQLLI